MRELGKVYKLIFSLPNKVFLAILLLSQFSIFLTLIHVLYGPSIVSISFIATFVVLAAGMPLILLKIPAERRALNLKRSLGVSNILMASLVIALILTIWSIEFAFVALSLFSILELYVMIGMVDWSSWKSAFFVFVHVLVLDLVLIFTLWGELIFSLMASPITNFIIRVVFVDVLSISISIFMTYSYFWIQSLLRKAGALEFIRALLFLKLDHKRKKFERMLEKISVEREVPIAITVFREKESKKPLLAIIGAQIHPGPLLNSGSSDFPSNLFYETKTRLGFPVVFLKGAVSHDANLPSLEEQRKLIDLLENEISNMLNEDGWQDEMCEPQKYCEEGTYVIKFPVGGQEYLIASNAPNNSDDLDTSLGYAAIAMGKIIGKNVFLVDAHNSLRDPREGLVTGVDNREYHVLMRLLREAIIAPCKSGKFMLGFSHNRCEQLGPGDGLGDLGLVAIAIRQEEKLYVIVIYDSNNINPEYYLEMKKKIEEEFGASLVELISTDTHTVCAFSPDVLYVILGERKRNIVEECTRRAVREAIENLIEVEVNSKLIITKLRVLGKGSTTTIKGASIAAVRTFLRDTALSYILATVLGMMLFLL